MYHSVSTGIFSNTTGTVIITQLNGRFSHVRNLIREVTALRWDISIYKIRYFLNMMDQFCHLRLYLGFLTVSCRLLQLIATADGR